MQTKATLSTWPLKNKSNTYGAIFPNVLDVGTRTECNDFHPL